MTPHVAGRLSRYFLERSFSRVWCEVIAAAALVGAVLSGCGNGGNSSPGPSAPGSSSVPAVTGSTTPVRNPPPVTVTGRANGHTIRLRSGEVLKVVLSSTYWMFHGSSDIAVLRVVGRQSVHPRPSGCVPGAGCGTATATYRAGAAGRARVVATRTSCGEAMACTAASGRFVLYVVVA